MGDDGLVSGEGVRLDLARAGAGSRTIAALIDLAGQLVALLVLVGIDAIIGGDDAALAALLVVEFVLVFGGYPIVAEWLTGRTLGKKALGLRVVRDDGGPIALRHAVGRGLAGLVLEKPGLLLPIGTAAGMLTLVFSPDAKRIGDYLAGTFVVNERAGPEAALVAPWLDVPYHLRPWAAALDLSLLDDRLALTLRQFVLRAGAMTPAAQVNLGEQLRAQLLAVLAPPPPPGTPTPAVLMTVLAERRRRGW